MKLRFTAYLLFPCLILIAACKPSAPPADKPAEKAADAPALPLVTAQVEAKALNAKGLAHEEGDGVAKDLAAAAQFYRQAADLGLAEAQFNLGLCYASGTGVTQDPAEAVKWYQRAAEQNMPEAQFNLGVAHDDGLGVAKDAVTAALWYRLAAKQGHENAAKLQAATEKGLSPEQLAAVEQRVKEFKPKTAK